MVVYNYAVYYHLNLHNFADSYWDSLKDGKDIERREQREEELKRRRMEQEMRRHLLYSDPSAYFGLTFRRKGRNWWEA
jgi:hypothetical protein